MDLWRGCKTLPRLNEDNNLCCVGRRRFGSSRQQSAQCVLRELQSELNEPVISPLDVACADSTKSYKINLARWCLDGSRPLEVKVSASYSTRVSGKWGWMAWKGVVRSHYSMIIILGRTCRCSLLLAR